VPNDGKGRDVLTSHAPADLQARLLRFLEKLEVFSEISVQTAKVQKTSLQRRRGFGERSPVVLQIQTNLMLV
jgi:hypothetical protein